jgi:hypothetical protein
VIAEIEKASEIDLPCFYFLIEKGYYQAGLQLYKKQKDEFQS